MAERKRKVVTQTAAAAEQAVNNLRVSPARRKKPVQRDNQSVETERSHYFTDNEPQRRLGEGFFSRPCISLAKALLGKVTLPCLHRSGGFLRATPCSLGDQLVVKCVSVQLKGFEARVYS